MNDTQAHDPNRSSDPAGSVTAGPVDPAAAETAAHPAPEPAPGANAAPATTDATRRGARTGPIVWGALILVFCAYIVQDTISPQRLDTTAWIIATTIGLGMLLLGVGAAVVLRGRG